MKFKYGKLYATKGVDEMVGKDNNFAKFVVDSVQRHLNGDWGDLDREDKRLNERALVKGNDRLFSRYNYNDDVSIYIITEWDRSATTILFPEEY